MITVTTANPEALLGGTLPRLLRGLSGCSYRTIDHVPELERSSNERRAFQGIGPALSEYYQKNMERFGALPKTKEEAAQRGVRNFDGLQVSMRNLTTREGVPSLDAAAIAPIRYSYLTAYQEVRKSLVDSKRHEEVRELERDNIAATKKR